MLDLALIVLRSVAALFVFFLICKMAKMEGFVTRKANILFFASSLFLWLCTLSTWALWMLVAGTCLFCTMLVLLWIAGKRGLKTNEPTDEEMRQFAEKRLPRPYTEEEIQVRKRLPLENRASVYLQEFRWGRFLSEEEMIEAIKEGRESDAQAAVRAAEQAAIDQKTAAEEKAAEQRAEKIRNEMKLPQTLNSVAPWKVNFDADVEIRKNDGTVLTLPGGTHDLILSCQFEAPEEADYYPKIPSELSIAGVPKVQGVIDLVALLDLFNIGQAFWWRDQGAKWQKSFQSNVVLGNVGCVEDAKERLQFKAGQEDVTVYFRCGSYFASLAVVEGQLWARVHALQHIDEDANYHDLDPFCFPIKASSLLEAWIQEEDLVLDDDEVE